MRNLLIITAIIISSVNYTYAEPIVLSDIIQQAREAQMKQAAKEKAEQAMMQPVKNNNTNSNCEQNANERICPNEVLEQTSQVK